jgi:uncharacterized membrane protein YtjA (UPF0391 family)
LAYYLHIALKREQCRNLIRLLLAAACAEILRPTTEQGDAAMLRLAIIFLVIALVAAIFGFGGVASLSWAGAKILFIIFLILAVIAALGGGWRRSPPI